MMEFKKWPSYLTSLLPVILFSIFYDFGEIYSNVTNHYIYNDDARQQIAPFLSLEKNNTSSDNYIQNYYISTISPLGINYLYKFSALLSKTEIVSKIIPYVLYFVVLLSLFYSSLKLGNIFTAISTILLVLSSELFLSKMVGGIARSFAYPIISLSILFLIFDRIYFLAILVVISALFYPVTSVISGLSLFIYLVVFKNKTASFSSKWSYKKRFTLLSVTAILTIIAISPQFYNSTKYGTRVTKSHFLEYPESGVGGRYNSESISYEANIFYDTILTAYRTLYNVFHYKEPLLEGFLLVTVIIALSIMISFSIKQLKIKNILYCRFLVIILATLLAYILSKILVPYFYMPQRYISFTLPIFISLIIPLSIRHIITSCVDFKKYKKSTDLFVVGFFVIFTMVTKTNNNTNSGYTVNITNNTDIYEYIESNVSTNSIIAGWPNAEVDNVTYLTGRNTYINYESHQVLHLDYMKEMRRRMNLLLNSYFSTNIELIKKLRDEEKVDLLIVDLDHFSEDKEKRTQYFRPFDKKISKIYSSIKTENFIVPKLIEKLKIFEDKNIVILDLNKI